MRGSVTHFLQGLAAGEGRREWELGGKLDGFVDLDASKLGLWSGLSLHSHAELNYGEALTSPGGTFLPTNVGMGFPGTESASGDLALFLAQQLPGGVRVMAGMPWNRRCGGMKRCRRVPGAFLVRQRSRTPTRIPLDGPPWWAWVVPA